MNDEMKRNLLKVVELVVREAEKDPVFKKELQVLVQELMSDYKEVVNPSGDGMKDTPSDLEKMTVKDLKNYAKCVGIAIKSTDKKADIIKKIKNNSDNTGNERPSSDITEEENKKASDGENVKDQRTEELPDPIQVYYTEGETGLLNSLEKCSVDELKTIIRKHRLDTAKKSTKWKDREKLTTLIVQKAMARANKGNVFLNYVD